MFLTVHSTAGIVIGQSIVNPLGAFFIGLISHYILDLIPHGDEVRWRNADIKKMAQLAALDHLGVILMLVSLWLLKPNFSFSLTIFCGIIGSMIPDWLMAVYRLTKQTQLPMLRLLHALVYYPEQFHHFIHHHIIKYELPFHSGMAWQCICFCLLWLLI
ncbi:MAG: hypothetical protein Q8Q23_06655 [bacterium]|nr:hypothetical protein [bacterium]